MNDKQIYLVIGLIISTLIFGMGVNAIDSTVSSMATKSPESLEGVAETLFFKTSFSFQYHLGMVLVFVSFILTIGIMLWYFQKKPTKE